MDNSSLLQITPYIFLITPFLEKIQILAKTLPGRTVPLSALVINPMVLCFCAMYFTCVRLFALPLWLHVLEASSGASVVWLASVASFAAACTRVSRTMSLKSAASSMSASSMSTSCSRSTAHCAPSKAFNLQYFRELFYLVLKFDKMYNSAQIKTESFFLERLAQAKGCDARPLRSVRHV